MSISGKSPPFRHHSNGLEPLLRQIYGSVFLARPLAPNRANSIHIQFPRNSISINNGDKDDRRAARRAVRCARTCAVHVLVFSPPDRLALSPAPKADSIFVTNANPLRITSPLPQSLQSPLPDRSGTHDLSSTCPSCSRSGLDLVQGMVIQSRQARCQSFP